MGESPLGRALGRLAGERYRQESTTLQSVDSVARVRLDDLARQLDRLEVRLNLILGAVAAATVVDVVRGVLGR